MRIGLSCSVLIFAVSMRLAGQGPQPPVQSAPVQTQLPGSIRVVQAPPTGSVTGHVYLGDTGQPARMAFVTLIPVAPHDANGTTPPRSSTPVATQLDGSIVITSLPQSAHGATELDGSFAIRHVYPGSYYVLAEKEGYISPIHLSFGGVDNLSKEEQDSLDTIFTAIVVAADHATNVEITLPKGADISGQVRFDDGERDSQAPVSILRKDKSGKWAPYEAGLDAFIDGTSTDDRGDFRISGLPEGEYLLKTSLESGVGGDYSIDIYYGDGIRLKGAKSIKVKDGEESDGNNIEIPLAKLHSVSGTVISVETGLAVKSAHVELHYADDDSLAAQTDMDWETGEFHLPCVPEGEYTLKARRVADNGGPTEQKPTREYEDAAQGIIVHGEMSGVTIQVKLKAVGVAVAQ